MLFRSIRGIVSPAITKNSRMFSSNVVFNFAAASTRDIQVYGAERPGADDEVFNPSNKIPTDVVKGWSQFLRDKGINRVLSLLNPEEYDLFHEPGYVESVKKEGLQVSAVNVFDKNAFDEVIRVFEHISASGEKLAVHCSGMHIRFICFVLVCGPCFVTLVCCSM